jgi:RNA polymerase sigma-70 factor (ECF subfamily)
MNEGIMDELANKAMAGDQAAFGKVVEREQAKLRAYVACRIPCADIAEDIAQESFVTAWQRRSSFDPTREIWFWLRGIARNLVLNERRKLSHREQLFEGVLDEVLEAVPEPEQADGPIFSALLICLGKLPEKMREFVRLRYMGGQSLSEIGAKLRLTAGSTRVTHVRILQGLHKCIRKTLAQEDLA